MTKPGIPPKQGLYDPRYEHDACGIGFVVNVKGRKSHEIVDQALTVLENLDHRGACGCEPNTGDGAGILLQVPHAFFRGACADIGLALPAPGQYGVGMIFLPPDAQQQRQCMAQLESIVEREGQTVLGWRDVPTVNADLGDTARLCEPALKQIFIGRDASLSDDPGSSPGQALAFERKLYVIRRSAENAIRYGNVPGGDFFYIASLSYKTFIYKGMLTPRQVTSYFPDLSDPRVETALAVVHSRFSTNTFPSWERSQPFRYLIHNGEINTLRGNENWMYARQAMLASELFGDDLPKLFPVLQDDGSDSAIFDNCLEFLALGGRPLSQSMMMMIPEPWENHESMPDEKKAFYEYHSSLMEPWDGPASIAFTDGVRVGAVLDRNGLRPSRYYVTKDDLVIMASEVGVLEVEPERVLLKQRLQPGRMFLVDTEQGRIISDEEIKHTAAMEHPYRQWLDEHLVHFDKLPDVPEQPPVHDHAATLQRQQAFGYSFEDLRVNIGPMAVNQIQPVGSMGTDTPLAVLSDKPQLLYNYFKQLFAQVTNPPLDPIREELITATTLTLGPERNLLRPAPESCRQIRLKLPILTNGEMEKLRRCGDIGFPAATLPMVFKAADGKAGLEAVLQALYQAADQAIADGATMLILSDKDVDRERAPIPALLASAGLHHHLIREGTRRRVGLVLESGEPREVHHFCLLLGYGVQAINPYMAYESLNDMIGEGMLKDITYEKAVSGYIKGAVKGVVKVMSKMGISTIQSYCGAQIFEAVGLSQELVDRYFTWTASRVGGIDLEQVALEAQRQHTKAFPAIPVNGHTLDVHGQYQYRKDGELHLFNPRTIHLLQKACRNEDYEVFKSYTALIDDQSEQLATLRGLMELKFAAEPIPLDEVEPAEEITRRFKTGAMSYGSISKEAHEALAIAMNRIGGKSNTGEGGEDPARYVPDAVRRFAQQRHQASRLGALRGDQLLPDAGQRTADQNGAGRQARRGRRIARTQGLSVDRQGAAVDAGRRSDFAAAAPRHLFYRGPGATDPRPEERQPSRAHQRQAGLRGGGRHHRRRGCQRPRRRGADQRSRRRHRRLPADQYQARRAAVGTWARRDAPDAGAERLAQPHRGRNGWATENRARRGGCRPARRRRIRFRHHGAGVDRLHHDAGVSPRYLPGGRRHAEPGAAREIYRRPVARRQFHALCCPGNA